MFSGISARSGTWRNFPLIALCSHSIHGYLLWLKEIIYKSDEQAPEDDVEEDEQNEEEITEHTDKEKIESEEDLELKAMMRIVLDDAEEYFNLHPNFSKEIIMTFTDVEDGGILSDMIAFYLNVKNDDYYEIISTRCIVM